MTQALIEAVGWRGAYLVHASLLAFVAAPLLAFVLPRQRAEPDPHPAVAPLPPAVWPPHGWPFVIVAGAFAAYAFVPSGLSAHLLAIFARAGIDPATAVAIGALFGPAQVAARIVSSPSAAICIRSWSYALPLRSFWLHLRSSLQSACRCRPLRPLH